MTKLLCSVVFCALSVLGADVSGKWSITLNLERGEQKRTLTAGVDLKQDGTKITGSILPDNGDAMAIEEGKIDGDKIHFEVRPHEGNDPPMVFELKLEGDQITGEVKGEHEGVAVKGKVEIKRVA